MIPCNECDGLVRFKDQAELDEHVRDVHHYLLEGRVPGFGIAQRPAGTAVMEPATAVTLTPTERALVKPNGHKETSVATHPNGANPDNCRLCARFAPERCKRHGGITRSTSSMGRKERAALAKKTRVTSQPPCSACHRADGTHTVNCRSKNGRAAAKPTRVKPKTIKADMVKRVAFKGLDMLRAAITQIDAETEANLRLLGKARELAKELAG